MNAPLPPAAGNARDAHDELATLLNTLADGTLTEADELRLREILEGSQAARQAFREFATLHAGLYWDYATLLTPGLPPPGETRSGETRPNETTPDCAGPGHSIRRTAAMLAAAAMAVATAVAVWLFLISPARPPVEQGLATVTQARFLLLSDPTNSLAIGQTLAAGRVALLGGAIELTLTNGVVITLEGPGEIDLQGELQAFLHHGNATVRMPKGMHGFRLATPSSDVLDLGTEFAVMAGGGRVTDVQVYDGEVIATGKTAAGAACFPKRLVAGDAVRFSPVSGGDAVGIQWKPNRFVRRLPADVGIPYHFAATSPDARWLESDYQIFGRPGQRESLPVIRANGAVTIDGQLDDWRDAVGFIIARDDSPTVAEWVDGRMMFDDEHLYIAAHVGDPMPMRNACDPAIDPGFGWRGGGLQVRLSTDRALGWPAAGNSPGYYEQRKTFPTAAEIEAAENPRLSHLTMWYHAASGTPCLTVSHGMDTVTLAVNPEGFRAAYRMDDDGRGYVAEYAIPWKLLNCADDPPQSGDVLAVTWQTMWGDEEGRLERYRLYDGRNPHEPRRIFVWERAATWGRAEYIDRP
jgi:ferric-dicitrate binding protein FerR (iron transport regulator)